MSFRMFSLLAAAAPLVLAACDNGPTPLQSRPLRQGAELQAPVIRTLPSPAAQRQYEPYIVPDNEEKGMTVGAVVGATGGQQAQKEKDRKAQAALEAEQERQREELARQQNADAKITTQ
jgi:hypothetical protein